MGLLFDENKATATGTSQVDVAFAKQLKQILDKQRIAFRSTIAKACDDFRKLRTKDEVSAERISEALDWMVDHAGKQYVPIIQSSKTLSRLRFS